MILPVMMLQILMTEFYEGGLTNWTKCYGVVFSIHSDWHQSWLIELSISNGRSRMQVVDVITCYHYTGHSQFLTVEMFINLTSMLVLSEDVATSSNCVKSLESCRLLHKFFNRFSREIPLPSIANAQQNIQKDTRRLKKQRVEECAASLMARKWWFDAC